MNGTVDHLLGLTDNNYDPDDDERTDGDDDGLRMKMMRIRKDWRSDQVEPKKKIRRPKETGR
jgi:hypothetical protein